MSTPSPRPTSPKAFISHSTKDRAFVEKLVADLNAEGIDAWYSGWDINPGDRFPEEINRGLEWCDFFIIILSSSSMSRPWVQTELYAALVRQHNGDIRKIIPIKVEVYGRLPALFEPLLVEDLSGARYVTGLSRVVQSILSSKEELSVSPPGAFASFMSLPTSMAAQRWIGIIGLGLITILLVSILMQRGLYQAPFGSGLLQAFAGFSVGGTIWAFFAGVDGVLTEMTRFEIAVWLVGLNTARHFQGWPDTFAKVFDRVFGRRHLSWKCFTRSCLATLASSLICTIALLEQIRLERRAITDKITSVVFNFNIAFWLDGIPLWRIVSSWFENTSLRSVYHGWQTAIPIGIFAVIVGLCLCAFDYVSLLETRLAVTILKRSRTAISVLLILLTDLILTGATGMIPSYLSNFGPTLHALRTYSQSVEKDHRLLTDELQREKEEDGGK